MDLGDAVHWLMLILEHGDAGDDFNVGSSQAVQFMSLRKWCVVLLIPTSKL